MRSSNICCRFAAPAIRRFPSSKPSPMQIRLLHNPKSHVQSTTPLKPYRAGIGRTAALAILVAFGFISYQSATEEPTSNPLAFRPYTITTKERLSPTNTIFTLRTSTPLPTPWSSGLWSVEFKQPQLQVARSYTPLPPSADPSELRFLIKKEPGGEVSSYLHRLAPGDEIGVRGPHVEYSIPEHVDSVLFVAGGTGIAPALQAAHTVLDLRGEEKTRVEVLWANRKTEDCLGRLFEAPMPWYRRLWRREVLARRENSLDAELRELQERFGERFVLKHFVDEEGSFISERVVRGAMARGSGRKVVLVSGPEGFITALAGKKEWAGGKETQGKLGGIIGRLGKGDWEVVKL